MIWRNEFILKDDGDAGSFPLRHSTLLLLHLKVLGSYTLFLSYFGHPAQCVLYLSTLWLAGVVRGILGYMHLVKNAYLIVNAPTSSLLFLDYYSFTLIAHPG